MKRDILYDLFRNILMVVIILLLTIPAAGAAPNRGLASPNEAMPAELKGVAVQDYYTGSGANAVGEIQSVVGHVVVFREDKQYAYFAAPKDKLFERDVIYTLNASRCRFQLFSSDTATMSENTRILIKTYINNRSTGIKSTSFVMKKGKAIFYALRLFMYKGSSMEVETPTAVSGVRGTKWGVEVIESKESASLPIFVADASDLGAFRQLAQANTGGGGYTIIHSFEGTVFVDSVPPGQSISLQGGQSVIASGAGLGNPYPTPPGTLQGLQGEGGSEGGGTGDGSLGSQMPLDTSSIIQGQKQSLQTRPLTRFGYYVGMLTNTSGGAYSTTYISTSLQNVGSTDAKAYSGIDDYAQLAAYDATTVNLVGLVLGSTATTDVPQVATWTETGYNAYMAWGYWTQPVNMTIGAGTDAFTNKGYYVVGDVTGAMPTSIAGTYSGIANGTVWTALGGTDYSGTFSMYVNFAGGTGSVSAFNVSIGTPLGAGASIAGGSGTITGNSFSLTGTGYVNNGTAGTGSANGSFYGPDAKMVGGVWQANSAGGNANGNFIGSTP
jgi:hypothetical protein